MAELRHFVGLHAGWPYVGPMLQCALAARLIVREAVACLGLGAPRAGRGAGVPIEVVSTRGGPHLDFRRAALRARETVM
jgi:hypothetical protein